jgi:DNA polymerase-3 subunit alpha
VRRFAKTKLKDLEPSREPRMLCGVITGVRTQLTQRGKILIVTLDDKTAVVEVTVYNELFEANKNIFREDEFLLVVGKVSEDRFNGGLRITAEKVFDIAARASSTATSWRWTWPARSTRRSWPRSCSRTASTTACRSACA